MHTNCHIANNDTPYDIREKELQWNSERTEIRLLKKEIDNASILFDREMKESSASIVDIFDKQNNTSSEQTAQQVNEILAKDYNLSTEEVGIRKC